jgi:hypothetical protein
VCPTQKSFPIKKKHTTYLINYNIDSTPAGTISNLHSIFAFSLNLFKQILADPANGANPSLREFLEGSSRCDTVFQVPFGRVIDIITDGASPFLHDIFSCYSYSCQWIQETGQMSMASCWIVSSVSPPGS